MMNFQRIAKYDEDAIIQVIIFGVRKRFRYKFDNFIA